MKKTVTALAAIGLLVGCSSVEDFKATYQNMPTTTLCTQLNILAYKGHLGSAKGQAIGSIVTERGEDCSTHKRNDISVTVE